MYLLYVQVVLVNVYSIFIFSYSTNLLRLWLTSTKWRLYFIGSQFVCYNREIQNNGDIDKIEVYFSIIQKDDKWSRAGVGMDNHQGSRLPKSCCSHILVTHSPSDVKDDCSVYPQHTRIPASTRGKREKLRVHSFPLREWTRYCTRYITSTFIPLFRS